MSSKYPPDPKEAGFTIIESLVAILVVSALLTAIAPVIGISAANRVQAKRIEQAANASRAYLDSLRTGEWSMVTTCWIMMKFCTVCI